MSARTAHSRGLVIVGLTQSYNRTSSTPIPLETIAPYVRVGGHYTSKEEPLGATPRYRATEVNRRRRRLCVQIAVICAVLMIATTSHAGSRQRVYVTDSTTALVSVVDPHTNTIVAAISVGTRPWGVVVSPDGRRVYVANQIDGTVSVIDTKTNKVVAVVHGFDLPTHLAATPDGTRVYVTNMRNTTNTVSAIDARTNTIVATISVGVAPSRIVITPDGRRAYVVNSQANSVSVIELATNAVLTIIQVGAQPDGIAITPDGGRVYVLNGGGSTVSVIDTATNTVEPGISLVDTFYPTGHVNISGVVIAITPDGARAFIPLAGGGTFSFVSVIETTFNRPLALFAAAPFVQNVNSASDVAINAEGKRAYLSIPSAGQGASGLVVVIDLKTNTTLAAIPTVGPEPLGIAVTPADDL